MGAVSGDESADQPLLQDGRQPAPRGALRQALLHRRLVRPLPDEQEHEHEVTYNPWAPRQILRCLWLRDHSRTRATLQHVFGIAQYGYLTCRFQVLCGILDGSEPAREPVPRRGRQGLRRLRPPCQPGIQ